MKKIFALISVLFALTGCCGNYWDGTWCALNNTITVTLDSSTKEADVTIILGSTPVNYTTHWEYIDNKSIVFRDYASSQYTIIKKGGKAYTYDSMTGEIIYSGYKFKKE